MNHLKNQSVYSLTLISMCFFSTAMAAPKNTIKGKMLCFGDSITYGAFVRGYAWDDLLNKKSDSLFVVNAGRKGRKTSDMKELPYVLRENLDSDYVLFFLGVNDLKNGDTSMVNDCVKNMKWMIDLIKAKIPTAKIVLLAPTDINLKTMSQINVKKMYNENTKKSLYELAEKYKKLAQEESVGFISLLHAVSPGNYVDGLHPDKKGQKEIENVVWKGLMALANPS